MIKQLISGQEIEFNPAGFEEDSTAYLTASVRLFGIQYSVIAIAVLYQDVHEGAVGDFRDPFGTYQQVAVTSPLGVYQDELEQYCPQVKEGRHLQTVKVGEREYVVFLIPFFE